MNVPVLNSASRIPIHNLGSKLLFGEAWLLGKGGDNPEGVRREAHVNNRGGSEAVGGEEDKGGVAHDRRDEHPRGDNSHVHLRSLHQRRRWSGW
ncbi:MAG: hypothetical protein J7K49_01755 [Thaumarchaeota archaeon]|nr:hypothetical protein [Nitrososphaerota archaeon]